MYNMDQIAGMDRRSLIAALNDAEKCLLQIEQVLVSQNGFKAQKADMMKQCEKLRKKIKGIPFLPGIIAFVVLAFFSNWCLLVLIGIIAAGIFYKKNERPKWEAEIVNITDRQIPAIDMEISQCDDSLNSLMPWAMNVKSLLSLLPENLRNLQSIRAIRGQLTQGAPNWFTAVQSYQSLLREQERDRQIREMQKNVEQVAASSERTAKDVEDIRKQAKDIARNTERTAAAAESSALNSARMASAAESSARSNAERARAAKETAANSARAADAAEAAANWIYYHS